MSKGSKRRPPSVPDKQVEENWQRIFGKPLPAGIKCSEVRVKPISNNIHTILGGNK